MPRLLLLTIVLAISLTVGACGFKLRQSWALPYKSLYLDIPPQSEFGAQLKRTLRGSQATRIVDKAEDAEASFRPTGESRERKIITYSSAGRVREVQLIYRYSFRIVDPAGSDLIDPATITMTRDMSYDEANALAKTSEEDLIWRDMMSDLTQQIMRQLAGATGRKTVGAGQPVAPAASRSGTAPATVPPVTP